MPEVSQMDLANRALCFAGRNPPPGVKKTPYSVLRMYVKNKNGDPPTDGAMSMAARDYHAEKLKRGRKKGSRKTTRAEDKKILEVFKKNRPPGCGIDSRELRTLYSRALHSSHLVTFR